MIKVTGFLQTNGAHYKDALIKLTPHLQPSGLTSVDAHLWVGESQVGAIGFENVPITIFDNAQGNAYNAMVTSIEDYIITKLQEDNADCTFTKI